MGHKHCGGDSGGRERCGDWGMGREFRRQPGRQRESKPIKSNQKWTSFSAAVHPVAVPVSVRRQGLRPRGRCRMPGSVGCECLRVLAARCRVREPIDSQERMSLHADACRSLVQLVETVDVRLL